LLRQIAAEQNPLRRMMLELHRCRRYYERPESQDEYKRRPNPKAKVPKVELARSEFHERCAAAGDHGELLRRLGLVVDLRVADLKRLRRSQWLAAKISLNGDVGSFRCPRLRCHAVGDALVSTPASADWADGAARGRCAALRGAHPRHRRQRAQGRTLHRHAARLLRVARTAETVDAASPALRSPDSP
jgi:hypothetical protein